MTDLISRQEAIRSVLVFVFQRYNGTQEEAEAIRSILYALPTQPERKNGKWVYAEDEYGMDGYHCNQCGFFVLWDYTHKFINYIEDYHFCPNCGADMRGEADED